MKYLFMWLLTIIISFGMDITIVGKFFKDIVDCGYKIDLKKWMSIPNPSDNDDNRKKRTLLVYFVPIFNIMQSLKNAVVYSESRDMMLDQLRVMDVLKEMSKDEKEEYAKKPTIFKAMSLTLISEILKSRATRVNFEVNGEAGEIVFDYKNNDIVIYETNGIASKMTVEEQKNKVKEIFGKFFLTIDEKYGSIDNFFENLPNSSHIDLTDKEIIVSDKEEKEELKEELKEDPIKYLEEQKQALQELKDELLESNKKEKVKKDNGEAYTKK